ncbi:tetratricopeptide repeat protein [Parabacteroides chongii]|uniref:tetratricopeptide repeat protein n=1 Tax=Parabacteroides chongii TaxID=2685834 RepID=UPI00240DEAF8|nr:tetratricopeptide repeat protein [Parabacteroides chongii]WFE83084.1 tetratricopeptide repeat protein [Parabacteroides chongii]
MTLQEINKAYNRIIGSLDSKELKNAFDSIQALISGSRELSFQDKLNELQDTYKYMLRYRIEGAKDPMQEQIYNKIQTSSYELADRIRHKALAVESPLAFYSRRRSLKVQPNLTFENLHLQLSKHYATGNNAEYDAILMVLFNKIWVSDPFTVEEAFVIKNILFDNELPFTTGCQIVSSLMLGLQAAFDLEKLMLLFDAAGHENEEIKVRALISILLTLYVYRKRTALYPQIINRLDALSETPGFTKAIRTITLRFILARETEKITRKLQNEIIPEMMKLSPKISNKINLKDITPEQLGEEMNPEWENIFADSSLGKKMEEFSELQQEGADVMHSTFVHLKSFPFFRELSNWLLPFTTEHSSFGDRFNQNNGEKQMLDSMTLAAFMCNSDKYSLYFSMMQLPEEAKKMMMNQFDSQASEMIQQNKEELISKRGKLETITGQYIQDLYRFFKIYPGHLDFNDIFTMPLDFHNLSILRPYISDEESLSSIAEYYLRKNYFSDALTIFNQLAETNQESDILFQKIGYCKQMNNDLQGALEAYLRADLLNPGSKWVIRRIAGCYRSLKEPEEALKYYRRYEKLNPDNLSITISIGHCYLELRNYSEALKCFYKVDYLDSNNKAWRPIAWCSFLTGKYDQARNYYKKILANQPNTQDLLNAGHTEWALQNIKGAIEFYRQAVEKENRDFYKFQEEFNQDIPDLIVAGIEDTEISLMMDQLRYVLSDSL